MPDLIGRVPPHNDEAEQSLLGAILLDKDALLKVSDLVRPDDFYREAHRIIYEACLELFARHEPIDLLSLSNRLAEKQQLDLVGGHTALAALTNVVPTAAHVVHYGQIVSRKAILRRMIKASEEIARLSFTEEDNVDTLLDKAQQEIYGVSNSYQQQNFSPIRDVLVEAFDRIDELHRERGKMRGIPTGFTALDNLTAGLQKSDLIIIAARPSVGKSSFVLDIARHVAIHAKVPTGIFSLEMSKEQLVDRLLCSEANIDLFRLRTGKLSDSPDSDDFPKLGHAMGVLSEAPLYLDDTPSLNITQIRTKARRLQMEHGLGLVIVDYLQLMDSSSSGDSDNRVQEVAQITRGLKGLARELNIPVIALSQLARAVEMSKPAIPKLSHLRESGCLTGDTLVQLADNGARVSIAELAAQPKKSWGVFATDNQWKMVATNATNVFCTGKKKIWELRTRSGRVIRATGNHPFLKLTGWTRLDRLIVGDHLAIPRQITPVKPPTPLNANERVLLAHLLGDGCVLPRQPIHYTSADLENIRAVEKAAQRLFAIKPRRVRQKNWWHVYLPSPTHLTPGQHNPITAWFTKLGLDAVRAPLKKLPAAIFQCNTKAVAHFLGHLWATDGNVSPKNLRGRLASAAIYYASSSSQLATDVQHLLLRLGIHSTVRLVPQKKHRPQYHVAVQDTPNQIKFLTNIPLCGARRKQVRPLLTALKKISPNTNTDIIPKIVWQTFVADAKQKNNLGWRDICAALQIKFCGSSLFKAAPSRARLLRLAQALNDSTLKNLATSDIFWDEIISITARGKEPVYDLTVPKNFNFLANDIFAHNSIEQDSDIVMFIYRKAADRNYRLEDIPPDERNLAEIHIAKHRNGPIGQVHLYFNEAQASFRNLETRHQ